MIQQLSLGKVSFEAFAANDVTAHVEIPVGPFALIRAIIQEKNHQTLSGHQLKAEAIEKNTVQLVLHYQISWFPKRNLYWSSIRSDILFLIRRCFPFLNMHFYPPDSFFFFFAKFFFSKLKKLERSDIFYFFFATKTSLRKFLISLYFWFFFWIFTQFQISLIFFLNTLNFLLGLFFHPVGSSQILCDNAWIFSDITEIFLWSTIFFQRNHWFFQRIRWIFKRVHWIF